MLTEESAATHVSDLAALRTSPTASACRCGDGKLADLFTEPDAIRRAAKRGTLEEALSDLP